ncbi:MAG: thiolase family protein [Phycisphaerales bacterium]|nr:MAG: thiolase family protein [Phycisphaerales bacterium]
MLRDVYLTHGVRTPFGNYLGSLSGLKAGELGAHAVKAALARAGVNGKEVDEVYMGCVVQAGLGQNVARQSAIGAGLPASCGATTVNKVCGSSMRAVVIAAQTIQCDDAHLIVAGGAESMSNAPYFLRQARTGYRMGDGPLVDGMIYDGLWDVYNDKHMGTCGDQLAAKYDITRQQQDDYAIASFDRAVQAWENGFYNKEEVVPIEIKTRKETILVEKDEEVSRYRGADKLRSLRPAFGAEGTVTAGNASGINDGAAAMLVFDDEAKTRLGIKPAARILGHSNHAQEPEWFGSAPIGALKKLSEKLSLPLSKVDLFEINEAFSVVALAAIKELKLDHDKVNVAGGAVSIGHPIGASGARIINTLVRALEFHDKRIGMAAICLGGGEASAIAVERC